MNKNNNYYYIRLVIIIFNKNIIVFKKIFDIDYIILVDSNSNKIIDLI